MNTEQFFHSEYRSASSVRMWSNSRRNRSNIISAAILARRSATLAAAAVPCVESLEGRQLFSTTYTVTNVNDDGPGSLRQAIIDANANVGADSIGFNIGTGPRSIRL